MTLFACHMQMRAFLLTGLAGLAASFFLLGHMFLNDTMLWPALLISGGLVCFVVALRLELKRTRGHAVNDVELRTRL